MDDGTLVYGPEGLPKIGISTCIYESELSTDDLKVPSRQDHLYPAEEHHCNGTHDLMIFTTILCLSRQDHSHPAREHHCYGTHDTHNNTVSCYVNIV